MTAKTLVSFVMRRLHSLDAPTVWHREALRFPEAELKALLRSGVLTKSPEPETIPHPSKPSLGPVAFHRTKKGLVAVAADEDDFFEPLPISESDVTLYEVSVPRLAERIRADNDIVGVGGATADAGLIPLGQKQVPGFGAVDVFLSLPNSDQGVFAARCLALAKPRGVQCAAVILPLPIALPAAAREQLDKRDIVLVPLLASTDEEHFKIDWRILAPETRERRSDGVYPPRTVVFRGLTHSCDLAKREMEFLQLALHRDEIDIAEVYSRKGPIWNKTFTNTKTNRDKIAKFLSRLNEKLSNATPPVPLDFSLPRDRQAITRTVHVWPESPPSSLTSH